MKIAARAVAGIDVATPLMAGALDRTADAPLICRRTCVSTEEEPPSTPAPRRTHEEGHPGKADGRTRRKPDAKANPDAACTGCP